MLNPKYKTAYFSVQPLIAWLLNSYCYGDAHYVYAARYFHPYRLTNPKSSNPYRIFADFYEAAEDGDRFDKFINQTRIGLRVGARNHASGRMLADLERICDAIHPQFFWPLFYLIDDTAAMRGRLMGSGASGSEEILVPDLKESEFEVIAPDVARLLRRCPGVDRFLFGPMPPRQVDLIRFLLKWS
jgi:hypothetical protein